MNSLHRNIPTQRTSIQINQFYVCWWQKEQKNTR